MVILKRFIILTKRQYLKMLMSLLLFLSLSRQEKKKKYINLTNYYFQKKLTIQILENLKQKKKIESAKFIKITQFKENENWLLTSSKAKKEMNVFENNCQVKTIQSSMLFNLEKKYSTIGDVCDIGNGLVSGLDKAFQLNGEVLNKNEKKHSIEVIKAKHLKSFYYTDITKYIFVNDINNENTLKTYYTNYYNKLIEYKEKLEKRYQYKRKIPYWNWVFLRNIKLFSSKKERIFVPCKERISNKKYFRFAYADNNKFPTQDVTAIFKKDSTKESIFYILAFLNNHRVFQWLINNGIIKGSIVEFSERPIASIPFRKINWDDENERKNHDNIVKYTKQYITTQSSEYLNKINSIFDEILKQVNDSKL
jgi:adenine-specific DNA-methyltransferase